MQIANERRHGNRRLLDEGLSPEFIAMLLACGGEVRSADRTSANDGASNAELRQGRRRDDRVASPPGGASSELTSD